MLSTLTKMIVATTITKNTNIMNTTMSITKTTIININQAVGIKKSNTTDTKIINMMGILTTKLMDTLTTAKNNYL